MPVKMISAIKMPVKARDWIMTENKMMNCVAGADTDFFIIRNIKKTIPEASVFDKLLIMISDNQML